VIGLSEGTSRSDIVSTATSNNALLLATNLDDIIRGSDGNNALSGTAGHGTLDGGVGRESLNGEMALRRSMAVRARTRWPVELQRPVRAASGWTRALDARVDGCASLGARAGT
jgi:hypothetical protein